MAKIPRRSYLPLNENIALLSLPIQVKFLRKILLNNKVFTKTLLIVKKSGLTSWYLAGGAIPQIFWNYSHHFDPNHGIKDFDIVYYDSENRSKRAERIWQKKIKQAYPNCPVNLEVVNEARTHLWYEKDFGKKIKPYTRVEEAIYSFPTTASAVGITLDQQNKLKIYAPHGLTDLLGLIVRANKIQIPKPVFEAKSKRWQSVWPKLVIVPWEYK